MPKSFIAALALIACSIASTAFAQSSDYSDGAGGGEAPTLVMPGLLTSPITSGLDSDGYGATGNDGADRDDRRTPRGPLFGRGRRATGT